MFLTNRNRGYNRHGGQSAAGDFLLLFSRTDIDGATEIRAKHYAPDGPWQTAPPPVTALPKAERREIRCIMGFA
jgi:hypothetical protein